MEVTIEKFNPWKDSLISGIFLLIIGIIMVALQGESLSIILIIAGILCLVMGAFTLYGGFKSKFTPTLVMGAVVFVIGLALLLVTGLVEDFMMAMLCIAIILIGLVSLLGMGGGFAVAKGSKIVTVVVGILMIIVGIYGLFNLDGAADLVMTVIGVILIIAGILQLVEFYQLKKVSS
ncbi:MAG TPA: DUF308 domain-containing protein [Euryarchaeota archaeon]|nr:DUF308 domain-containing protein [Euryarchaeota archaeon]